MRIYVAADAAALRRLRDGGAVEGVREVAVSEDEEAEFDAMAAAAGQGPVVVAAEIARADDPVTLEQVEAFHVDADGSGDLAWYATQELDDVLTLLHP